MILAMTGISAETARPIFSSSEEDDNDDDEKKPKDDLDDEDLESFANENKLQ